MRVETKYILKHIYEVNLFKLISRYFRLGWRVKDIQETELIRINRDLSIKLRKAVNDYDFTVREFVQWILSTVDLDEYAEKLQAIFAETFKRDGFEDDQLGTQVARRICNIIRQLEVMSGI